MQPVDAPNPVEELTAQITREYRREQGSAREAVDARDIPISYEAITDAWLTQVLCRDRPDARVVGHRLDAPDDGNTNRRRIHLVYNSAEGAIGLPASVFCKALHKLGNRLVDAAAGLIEGEDLFYNHYRPMLQIEAPVCYWAVYDRRSFNSIVVLDDLERHGAEFCRHDTRMTKERAQSQLDLLARMHAQFYDRIGQDPSTASLRTWEQKFELSNRWFDLESC